MEHTSNAHSLLGIEEMEPLTAPGWYIGGLQVGAFLLGTVIPVAALT